MKVDEFGDDKEDLDVFKMHIIYYMELQKDELFQSILDIIHELVEDGWKYKDTLDCAIQWKKVDIRSKVGQPFVPGLR